MERWEAIVQRALTDAEQGDPRAREWVGSYVLGKPTGSALQRLRDDEEGTFSLNALGWP